MARSGTGIGYTPSQSPTSMPGGFDEEQMAIARKRLMLQQLANEAPVDSGYRGSHWVNPYLGQLASGITGAFAQNEQTGLDAQAQDVAARRSAAADEWLGQMPQDTPADPGQEGTGPIAPPPGTSGVEQRAGAGMVPQPQFAPPAVDMETGAPTMLADTQMQPMQAAPDAPMVPQSPQDFVPNRAATPMIPTKVGDMAKWAAKGAAFSPMHAKVAEKALDTVIAAPEKEAARAAVKAQRDEDRAVRMLADKQRQEDRLADNKRQERALEAQINNQNATQEERRLAREQYADLKRESLAIQREGLQDKRDAAAGKRTADDREIDTQVKQYGTALNKEKIPQLDAMLTGVETLLAKYAGKDVPGIGLGAGVLPEALLSKEGVEVRRAVVPLRRLITTSEAGLSQTAAEMKGVLENLGLTPLSPESSFVQAIPKMREILEERKNTLHSSYLPEAVDRFHGRANANRAGGGAAPAAAGDGWGVPTKR